MAMDSVTESAEPGLASPTGDPAARPDLETVLLGAVDDARAAIVEFSGEDTVGEYLGAGFEDPTAATHRFLADMPGYRGWQWAVVVAACPGADHATISEVVLVPGPTALLAPKWVPWHERVKPGDLSPGDLLAPPADDPRLVPGFMSSGDPEVDEVAAEVGFGRKQVLGPWGRADAAQRWHDGEHGPGSAMARSTRRVCRDCGFYLPVVRVAGFDVRRVRQRDVGRRPGRRRRIRLRRTFGYAAAGRHRLAALRSLRRRRARPHRAG